MTAIPTKQRAPHISRRGADRRRGGGAGPSPAAGVSGRDIIRILRKRKWLILIFIVLFTGIAFVATFLWSRYAPSYSAYAIIGVKPPASNPLVARDPTYGTASLERRKRSLVRMVKRLSVLRRAIQAPKVRQTQWFRREPVSAVARLTKSSSVSAVRETDHIEIAMTGVAVTGRDRTDLAEIATAVAEAFIEETRKAATEDRFQSIEQLHKEREDLIRKINVLATKIETNQRSMSDVAESEEQEPALAATLTALTRQRLELNLTAAQMRAVMRALEKMNDAEKSALPSVVAALQRDPNLPILRSTEVSYANELESALRKFGARHRTVRDYRARIENISALIAKRESQLIRTELERLVENYRVQDGNTQARLAEVGENITRIKESIRDAKRSASELSGHLAERRGHLDNVDRIDKRLLELRVQRRKEQPVYLVSAAETPGMGDLTMPRWGLMIPAGVLLGLTLGLALTFLLEFMDTSIKGPADMTRRVDLPILGVIPHVDDIEEDIADVRVAFQVPTDSLVGESFRQIRTNVLFSGPIEQRRSVMITSATPEDGRTTIALNLAAATARGGRTVLVIDANFRKPIASSLLAREADGLSNALVGQAAWQDLVRPVEENFSLLPAGPLPPNPAELLGSPGMKDLIAEAVTRYDQVLVDSAPCTVVTDPTILGASVDGVVIVVRADRNTYGIVQRTRNMLTHIGAHVLGVVLNGIRVTAGGYLRKNYETFYQYGSESDTSAN